VLENSSLVKQLGTVQGTRPLLVKHKSGINFLRTQPYIFIRIGRIFLLCYDHFHC